MQQVKKFPIKNLYIEYFISESIHLYNPKNQRMVEVNSETFEFIKNYEKAETPIPAVENFLFGKRKRRLSEIKILDLEVDTSKFNYIMSSLNKPFVKFLSLITILFFFFTIPYVISKTSEIYTGGITQFNIADIVLIYILQFFIVIIHELGHYITYRKRILNPKLRFGITVRYFFLLMFFTNVNFMRNLKKSDRIWIILSGVIGQFLVGGILSIVILVGGEHKVLYYIYFINLLVIITNLIPFLRLDGYWLLNEVINSKGYMNSFKNFIHKKDKIRPVELIFSLINILIIILILFTGFMYLYNLI